MKRILFVIGLAAGMLPPLRAQPRAEAKDVVLVGHNDLNGNGDGGEGLAIQQVRGCPSDRGPLDTLRDCPNQIYEVGTLPTQLPKSFSVRFPTLATAPSLKKELPKIWM